MILALVLGFAIGIVAAIVSLSGIVRRTLPEKTFYGMCTGQTTERDEHGQDALTDWLAAALDGRG